MQWREETRIENYMGVRQVRRAVPAIDAWGRRPVYRARIVNSETASIVIKSGRLLAVGNRISFAKLTDLGEINRARAMPASWRSGVIWRIDKGCLYLTRT